MLAGDSIGELRVVVRVPVEQRAKEELVDVVDSVGCGEDRAEARGEQAVAAEEPVRRDDAAIAPDVLGDQGVVHGLIFGTEVGPECEAERADRVPGSEVESDIRRPVYQLRAPDVLEVATECVGLALREGVQEAGSAGDRAGELAEAVAEAEVVVGTALIRAKWLEGGLGVSAEVLAVGEGRLVRELDQPDVDQTA